MIRDDLEIEIFGDSADLRAVGELAEDSRISGFTTNPLLMEGAGVTSYEEFGKAVLDAVGSRRPVSFEVLSTEPGEIRTQAKIVASWGPNVVVKVPVLSPDGASLAPVIADLAQDGIAVNVTAVCTLRQVETATAALAGGPGGFVSIFAGRIADTGRDPVKLVERSGPIVAAVPGVRRIWASPREVWNVVEAARAGCEVITLTPALIDRLASFGRELEDVSLDTVRQFEEASLRAGLEIRG